MTDELETSARAAAALDDPDVRREAAAPRATVCAVREALEAYDAFLSGKPIGPDTKAMADRASLAAAFAAAAYEKGYDRGQATHALLRSFLTAMLDPASPDLDYLRAVNQEPILAAKETEGIARGPAAPRAAGPLRGQAEAIINDWEEQASERDRRDPMRARIMQEAAVIRAALAAAPQSAPVDRDALVKLIRDAVDPYVDVRFDARDCASDTADALLAAGLRLPGEVQPDETLAWAVVGDGAIMLDRVYPVARWARTEADTLGKRVVRVAIRRVEDEA